MFSPRPGAGDPGNPVRPGHPAARNPGHPEAAEIREQADKHRSSWLRGHYGLLGQAYLTLVPVR